MENRQLGGIGFLLASSAMFANGLVAHLFANTPQSRRAGLGRMASSALWSGNALILAKYGDQPVIQQQERLEEKLAAYLHGEGVPLSVADMRKADKQMQRSWFGKLEDFLYAHPIECSNAYNAVASTGYGISGYLRRQDGNRQAGNANLGVTGLTLVGALASILIPERTPQQIRNKGQDGTLWGKIQEHPLGYVRWIFLGVDALAGMEAVGEYRAAKALPVGHRYRPWQFGMAGLSIAAMATAMVSDWLTSGSKKAGGSPEARDAAQQAIENAAVRHLAAIPVQQREALAKAAASFLTAQPELRYSDRNPEQVAQEILQKLAMHPAAATKDMPVSDATHVERLMAAGVPAPIMRQ